MSAATTTLPSTDDHQDLSVADNSAVTHDMTPGRRDSAFNGASPSRVAILRSPEHDDRGMEAIQDDIAVPQAQVQKHTKPHDIADNTVPHSQPTTSHHEIAQVGDQGARYATYSNPQHTDNNHDDLDPAALLESLASFDQSQVNNTNAAYGDQDGHGFQINHQHQANQFENDHFASLLQAAATAGQNQENDHHSRYGNHSSRESQPLQEWGAQGINTQQPQRSHIQKRKHSDANHDVMSTPNTDLSAHLNSRSTRRRLTTEADDAALAREHAIWGSQSDHSDTEEPSTSYAPLSPSSARAVGVHSAAALFRKPTPASKKYTRPPMSKLFTSLELSPEQFLHLQAAAKAYMLNPAHPDRYNCVGSKARVDTDMVKLKLFGCVERFLEEEGWGGRCWGANAEREAVQGQTNNWRLRWPEGRNKIITSVTPLMRRMVTNERQRRYANETRSKEKGGKTTRPGLENPQSGPNHENKQLPQDIDPKLSDYHYTLAAPNLHHSSAEPPSEQPVATSTTTFKLVLLSPTNTNQIIHSATLVITTHESYYHVVQYLRSWLAKSEISKQIPNVLINIEALRAHLPNGLHVVDKVEDWEEAVKIAQETVWMEGCLKVVVEVGTPAESTKKGSEQELRMEHPT